MNLFDEYQWRGMIHEATPELKQVLAAEKLTAYIGFDPSGRFLIAANQDTGELITFRVDAATGALDHRNGM